MAGDDDELLTIGEVAKLDGITAKALRYYDAHNILKPAAVDPATGYRLPATDTTPRSNAWRRCDAYLHRRRRAIGFVGEIPFRRRFA
ncbi:MerR family DNA-binding transcriptional regulator [Bifidobacterium pseudocatenulatum]|uniref:MerR family DNA-binding transcriptional regulator n=2 Tax=Bifidobacterium pseudocatenulatum TaxID=28026 RepID=UPI003CE50A0C